MESSSIELKVLTCKDLKAFNFFQKLSVYALVSIVSDSKDKKLEKNQQQKTPIDREGDGNPEWNHEMRFDLDEASILDCDHLLIHFQLHAEVVVFGDKIIGEVRVPFKDLIGESNGIVRFVSYEVRSSDAKPNGVLNFSYKVNAKGFSNLGNASSIGQIDGYYSVEQDSSPFPSAQVHYPTVEIHSSPSSPPVQYPSLDLYSPSSLSAVQHISHHAYYPSPHEVDPPPPPPPPPHEVYPPPPPPPPPHHGPPNPSGFYHPYPPPPPIHQPPPPPPPLHHGPPYPSGFYHPYPPPPPFHQWEFAGGYGGYGSASPGAGWSEMSNNGEMRPSDFQGERDWHPHPSSWNGR